MGSSLRALGSPVTRGRTAGRKRSAHAQAPVAQRDACMERERAHHTCAPLGTGIVATSPEGNVTRISWPGTAPAGIVTSTWLGSITIPGGGGASRTTGGSCSGSRHRASRRERQALLQSLCTRTASNHEAVSSCMLAPAAAAAAVALAAGRLGQSLLVHRLRAGADAAAVGPQTVLRLWCPPRAEGEAHATQTAFCAGGSLALTTSVDVSRPRCWLSRQCCCDSSSVQAHPTEVSGTDGHEVGTDLCQGRGGSAIRHATSFHIHPSARKILLYSILKFNIRTKF